MARSRKSRKEGALMKKLNLKRPEKVEKEPRKRKVAGNKAGSRQQVIQDKNQGNNQSANKDPRHGSKKAIDLGVAHKPEKKQINKQPLSPIAAVTVIDSGSNNAETLKAYEQELQQLENNEALVLIAARIDSGDDVSAEEAGILEKAQQRYQELLDLLGIEETDQDDIDDDFADGDEQLWDRLEDSDFSDYKE